MFSKSSEVKKAITLGFHYPDSITAIHMSVVCLVALCFDRPRRDLDCLENLVPGGDGVLNQVQRVIELVAQCQLMNQVNPHI